MVGMFSEPGSIVRKQLKTNVAFCTVVVLCCVCSAFAERPIPNKSRSTETVRGAAGTVAACVDNDGDGYGAGCAPGDDCNDDPNNGGAAIHPGATEICNGEDDNCDGNIDEGFSFFGRDGTSHCKGGADDGSLCKQASDCSGGFCLGDSGVFGTLANLPLGRQCVNGSGICLRIGNVVCSQDGLSATCDAVPGTPDPRGEGCLLDSNGVAVPDPGNPGHCIIDITAATCFDRLDNDCDGLVDHGDANNPSAISPCKGPEICNGFDDDNNGLIDDGLGLGTPCTVGVGACQNTGEIVCDSNGGTKCSAVPYPPFSETGPGSARCTDGIDNDCDGLTDLADPGCQEPEKCDGKDNNGDGQIDETFIDLGALCSAGVGACKAFGVKICSADGLSTVCSAIPLKGSPEGPAGTTCTDGIDNDCDGLVDSADPGCGAANLKVGCSLPYTNGRPGNDCTGKHTILWSHNGSANTVITAEIMALDQEGNVLRSELVKKGDEAHLASRISPKDFIFKDTTSARGVSHQVFAPVPMLRVIAQDGDNRAEAYCSNIPFLEVIQPSNSVVTGAGGDTPVLAAMPRVDPKTLVIMIDGVDILQATPIGIGLNPATAFPGGPYSGTANINGATVSISLLTVSSGAIDVSASNTVGFTVGGLGCGTHVVEISGQRQAGVFPSPPGRPAASCYIDDLKDTGTSIVFTINITSPIAGQIVGDHPATINVQGEACHGVPIASANINGFSVDPSGQIHTPGGSSGGEKYVLPINVNVPVTDLRNAVSAHGGLPGTFDPGSNRLIAQALDGDFNAVYDSFFFAVGPVIPGPAPVTSSAHSNTATDPSFVDRAFVLAINDSGVTNFFDAMKNKSKKCLGDQAKDALKRTPTKEKKLKVDGACDPPTKMIVNNTDITLDQFSLNVTSDNSVTPDPREGVIHVKIGLPPVDITAHFSGYCQDGCICAFGGCACAVCVTVNVDGRFNQKNMSVSFDLDRPHILQGNLPRDQREKLHMTFDLGESDPNDFTKISGDVDIGCLLGFILDVIDFFAEVITFGLWDPSLSDISFEMTGDQIQQRLNSQDGDPMDTDFVKFKNDDLPQFGTKQKDSKITDAAIGSTGIAVTIGAGFAPDAADIDPQAANIPGTPLKNAPIPIPPIVDAAGNPVEDVTIAIAADVFNQLFYSMVQTGKLKTQFEVSKQLGTLVPSDCAGIGGNTSVVDSSQEARCIGFQDGDCTQFPFGSEFRRQCRRGSRIGRNTNIRTGTNIIFHGSVQNPPVLLLDDDPNTPDVEVTLRYPQISLYLIADRANNQILDTGSIDSTPMCTFGDLDADNLPNSTATSDCILWEFCMTIDLNLSMQFDHNPNTGRDRLKFNFLSINRDTPFGVACNGSSATFDLDFLNNQAGKTQTFDILQNKLKDNTPPLEQNGLDLGGFVNFTGKRIVAIETDHNPDGFQDYIGITGTITSKPVDPNAGCDAP